MHPVWLLKLSLWSVKRNTKCSKFIPHLFSEPVAMGVQMTDSCIEALLLLSQSENVLCYVAETAKLFFNPLSSLCPVFLTFDEIAVFLMHLHQFQIIMCTLILCLLVELTAGQTYLLKVKNKRQEVATNYRVLTLVSIKNHVFCSIVLYKVALITAPAKCFLSGQGQHAWQYCRRTKDNTKDALTHHIYITPDQFTQLTDTCTLLSRDCQQQIQVQRTWLCISNEKGYSAINHHC